MLMTGPSTLLRTGDNHDRLDRFSLPLVVSVDPNLLLLDRQIQQLGSGSGDPLRAFVIY